MALIYEWGFFVRPERKEEFRDWLVANESRLARAAPRPYQYLGTYVPLWTRGEPAPDFLQMWRHGKSEGFDLRQAAGEKGELAEVAREYLSFVDESRAAEETFRLHRSVTDAEMPRESTG